MRKCIFLILTGIVLICCKTPQSLISEYSSVSSVDSGKAQNVMLTVYSTTLIADGNDQTNIRIAVMDSLGREINLANDSVRVYIIGDGKILYPNLSVIPLVKDEDGNEYAWCKLDRGQCRLLFRAGTKPDKVKLEARVRSLWPASHEIHTIPSNTKLLKPNPEQLKANSKNIDKMSGADISFLPELEKRGIRFFENGIQQDGILLFKNHGFNYIRLRVFVNPETEKGYSPKAGFCDLTHTLEMAKRVKNAGLKLLLDFHYSDYWADPQQQNKPAAWQNLDFNTLKDSVREHTLKVLEALKKQGTFPDMVQVGNEINHGMIWPDGHISNLDQLAELIKAGIEGVTRQDPNLPVMLHLALGGQNKEAVFWLDNMMARDVKFDIIGLSYYPRWHGTLDDLKQNLTDLIKRYHKPVNVVEYANYKKEVNDIVFGLPNHMGKGTAVWEPLSWNTDLVKGKGEITDKITIYDEVKRKYLDH